jgi:general secretion pathway protein J
VSGLASRSRCQAGFTLLEVVVALAILGLVMTALAGGLGFSLKASRAGERMTDDTLAIARLDGLLRHDLERALRLRTASSPHAPLAFTGSTESLAFTVAAPSYPTAAGLYQVSFAVLSSAGGETLSYSRRAAAETPAPEDADERPRALIEGTAARISFAYFDGKAWRDRWLDAEALPRLVRLRLADGGSGGLLWPDIIVGPAAEADPECPDRSRAQACAGGN